jgi:membrane protein
MAGRRRKMVRRTAAGIPPSSDVNRASRIARAAKWQRTSVGAVFATVTWFAGSTLLSYYFANFANYNATYGSLGAAIGTMMWMWMSAIVVLFGAELNSEIEHQTARDTTVGPEKPLGVRGATMADTVGAAQ